ncbi:hypothetical protein KM043_016398 [Ampulex compressa]|nr:hypothetical protein KM043_016398 [Ampulex compressa]
MPLLGNYSWTNGDTRAVLSQQVRPEICAASRRGLSRLANEWRLPPLFPLGHKQQPGGGPPMTGTLRRVRCNYEIMELQREENEFAVCNRILADVHVHRNAAEKIPWSGTRQPSGSGSLFLIRAASFRSFAYPNKRGLVSAGSENLATQVQADAARRFKRRSEFCVSNDAPCNSWVVGVHFAYSGLAERGNDTSIAHGDSSLRAIRQR